MQRFLGKRKMVPHSGQHKLWERSSEAPHSGGSLRKWLLITASILSCCIQPKSAQVFTVVPDPPYGTEGSSVTLNIQGFSGNALAYNWYYKTSAEDPKETYIVRYIVLIEWQIPKDTRQTVLSNGSLLITNLFLNDTKYYIVYITDATFLHPRAGVYLTVYGSNSPGGSNGNTLSGGAITGILIGVLAGVALLGGLIYVLITKNTGGGNKDHPQEKQSAPRHGEDITVYENTASRNGSALPAQGLGSSSVSPKMSSESPYQVLDTTKVDVYEKITPGKNPQAYGRGRNL